MISVENLIVFMSFNFVFDNMSLDLILCVFLMDVFLEYSQCFRLSPYFSKFAIMADYYP